NTRFRGDVETVVGKALEKDRERRYASAAALGLDIRRYLNNEPIQARPPSAWYKLRKFTRRHKALVVGAVGGFAALLAGALLSFSFARNAGQNAKPAGEERRAATYEAYRARLAAATSALVNHDVADAASQLEAAPEELRGWEWRHLHSRLDDSIASFPAPSDRS